MLEHDEDEPTTTPTEDAAERAADLRLRAEAEVAGSEKPTGEDPQLLSEDEARHALHELRVHQIELEMQNDELRRTQDDLALAHGRYRDLFEQAPVGYLTVDGAGKILQANFRAASMLGVARTALIDRPIVRLILSDDQDRYYLHRRRLLDPGATDSCELRMVRLNAPFIWVEMTSTLVWSDAGLPINRIALTDITLRKSTQMLLQQSEARSQAISQSAHDAIITVDEGGQIVGWNHGAESMFGAPERTAIGSPVSAFLVPSETNAQVRGRRLDHTEFSVERTVATWTTEDGQFTTSIVRDITERERAAALLHLEGTALEASANAIVITNRDGVMEWVNPAFSKISGYEAESAIGTRPGDLLGSGEQDASFYSRLWQTVLSGAVWQGEMVDRRKDGTLFTAEMTITPVKDESGAIAHFIAISQDITQRKKLEEQLRQAQKMESIGRLAGGVAHDFNNMLTVILGRAEMALNETDPDRAIYADLAEIRKAATRSAELTKQLLAFARKQQITPAVLDINTAISSALEMLQRLIGDDVVVHWVADGRAWDVRIDPTQIDQVLTNLFLNARTAMPKGGHLKVTVENLALDAAACASQRDASPGDFVRIVVEDDGIGMTPEVLGQIFEPFFTTKPIGAGTGLGLATVHGIVAQAGGFVTATSTLGNGARFEVNLPRYVGATRSPVIPPLLHPPISKDGTRGNETILLVDDERLVREVAQRALELFGYRVIAAASGAEALTLAAEYVGDIQLLLTDVLMPGMNGRQLAETLLVIRPSLRVLYMSGFAAAVLTANGELAESTAFLEKPFSVTELAERVRALLHSPVMPVS